MCLSAPPDHPRLFFDRNGLNDLRIKANDGQAKQSFDAALSYAAWAAGIPFPKPTDYRFDAHLSAIMLLDGRAENLAFSWLMTRNEAHARVAKQYLLSVLEWKSWQDSREDDLSMAFMARGFSIGYDWLYDYLSPEERTVFLQVIEKAAGWIYRESVEGKQWWTVAYAQNHLAISHACLGLGGLALMGEHPDAQKWVNLATLKVERYLDNGSPDGGWGEGVHYWEYGTRQILVFADALRHVTGKDLYAHWWLHKAWQFPFYSLSPSLQGMINFADSNYETDLVLDIGVTMLRLAAEYRNGYAQWFAQTVGAVKKDGYDRTPWNFIWYDPSVTAIGPADLLRSKLFSGIGWAVLRTGWNESDTLFALRAGSWWVHTHADQNSFILEAYGERFVIDPGYGWGYSGYYDNVTDPYVGSIGHNTVLVDGVGQDLKHPEKRPLDGGSIRSFVSAPGYDYVFADASLTYLFPMQSFTRQVTWVKPLYFVMYDELKSKKASVFSWLLHTVDKIEVNEDTAIIRGGKASLIIKILSPEKWSGQVLHDQKHMKAWEEEEPMEYLRIDSQKVQNCRFLVVMIPTPSLTDPAPFSISPISEASVLGTTVVRGDIVDKHLFRLTGDKVTVEKIQFDGRNCFVASTSGGSIRQFALQDGGFLTYDRSVLVSSSRPIDVAMIFTNDTTEGSLQVKQDSTIDLALQDRPALILLNGTLLDQYEFDSDNRTLKLSLAKGSYSLKIWGQSSYEQVQRLLQQAHEKYDETVKRGFSSQTAIALVEQSHALIDQAVEAFDRYQPDLAREYTMAAVRLLDEATAAEERYQTETPQTKTDIVQPNGTNLGVVLAFIAALTVIPILLVYTRRRGRRRRYP